MSEVKKYSLRRKEFKFPVEQLDGTEATYTLVELIGAEKDKFLNLQAKKTVRGSGGAEIKDYTGSCSDLLAMCVLRENGTLIPAKEIDDWPSEMQLDLFMKAVRLSALDKTGEDEEKND